MSRRERIIWAFVVLVLSIVIGIVLGVAFTERREELQRHPTPAPTLFLPTAVECGPPCLPT